MKFKKEKMELLSRCRSWDVEGLQEIKDIVVELKLASKSGQSKTMAWQPSLHISQKGCDLTPTFFLRITFYDSPLTSSATGVLFFSSNSPTSSLSQSQLFLLARLHASLLFSLLGSNPSSGSSLDFLDTQSPHM